MRLYLLRLLLVPLVCQFLVGRVEADPLIAFSNIPPPSTYKSGGSSLYVGSLKALLFTTPTSAETEITSIKVGLTYCGPPSCTTRPPIIPNYPSFADFQISLYSTSIQSGVRKPDAELYKIPMQLNLQLTGVGTEFTFDIPNWRLARNTTYALVGGSTDTKPVKWANIELGVDDYPPQPQNGFSFNSSQGFTTAPLTSTVWDSAGAATNNSVEMKFVYASSTIPTLIPTLSEWAQIMMMMLMMIATAGFYGWRMKQR